ncbi:MAG: LamG domain-containing protein, partial [Calditrichaeota bacterium]|nr:LamG domain-containing protein [Calditrichota bacterium]
MKMMIMILMMMAVTPAGAGTLYVDSGVNRQLKTAGEWNTGSLTGIARPTKLWIFASGVGYDKTGANYNQYGSVAETNAFQDGGAPLLCEGMLAPHQSAELFDGATTYLTKNVADPPVTQTTFTIAAWAMSFAINEVGQGQQAVFLQRDNVADSNRPLILVSINSNNGSNYPRLVICSTSGSQQVLSGEEVLSYGQWHFLAGVCDRAGEDSIKLYADGSIIARVKENQAGNYTTGLNSIYIGRLVNSAGDQGYLNGAMCWLAIWDGAALTKAQLDSVRAVTRPTGTAAKPYPSIQSAVRMADGLGTTTLLLNSGYYQETLQILNDSLTISAANTAFGYRPVLFGGALSQTLSGADAIWVQAKTAVNYIDIRGYAGRGVLDSTHTPANYGDQFDHLTIDSCLVGIRLNAASIAAIYNCTIDGE